MLLNLISIPALIKKSAPKIITYQQGMSKKERSAHQLFLFYQIQVILIFLKVTTSVIFNFPANVVIIFPSDNFVGATSVGKNKNRG